MKTLIVFLVVSMFSEAFLSTFRKDAVVTPSPPLKGKTILLTVLPKEFIHESDPSAVNNAVAGVSTKEDVRSPLPADNKSLYNQGMVQVKAESRIKISTGTVKQDYKINVTEENINKDVKEESPATEIAEERSTEPTVVKAIAPAPDADIEVKASPIFSQAVITTSHEKATEKNIINTVAYSNTAEAAITDVSAVERDRKAAYTLSYAATRKTETGTESYSYMTLYEKAEKLKDYAKAHGYSTRYGFLVNMGMKSGRKRFFIVDLTTMIIIKNGVVAHGRGDSRFTLDKKYSNKKGSNCTSLGIYKVGNSYNGLFGKSFRLLGLQKSNSNAYKRAIVLHSMHNIPNLEIEYPIFQSEGCPSVAPEFLDDLSSIIHRSTKPVLMWIFDPSLEDQALYSMN